MESKTAKEEVKKPGTPAGINTEIVGTVSLKIKFNELINIIEAKYGLLEKRLSD